MTMPLYLEIQADDLSRALQFYRAVFGWQFKHVQDLPVEYWRMETDGLMAGMLQRPAATPPSECGTNAFVCSLAVQDFDKTASIILSLGGQVALDKFAVPGRCWQGYFIDTEGNTFGIFEADLSAS